MPKTAVADVIIPTEFENVVFDDSASSLGRSAFDVWMLNVQIPADTVITYAITLLYDADHPAENLLHGNGPFRVFWRV